jgi:hypothetical protein
MAYADDMNPLPTAYSLRLAAAPPETEVVLAPRCGEAWTHSKRARANFRKIWEKWGLTQSETMCQHVCVSGTQHVSVRMPAELVAAIDLRAARENRSRGQVVVLVLRSEFGLNLGGKHGTEDDDVRGAGGGEAGEAGGSGDGAAVSVLPKAEGTAERLHAMQSVRGKLAGRRGPVEGPAERAKAGDASHDGHRVNPSGDKRWCVTCGVYF